ncbi:MAG TPA: hypothetical protein VJ820_19950 [Propionibacteriaceae bacterium]|nr:hypothetical protein [Propionibacteriaceae bacterium]
MSVPPAPATEWTEPTRYLPSPEPRLRAAAHSFRGQDDIDGVVRLFVDYLAAALRQV